MKQLLAVIAVFEAFSLAFLALIWFFVSLQGGSVTISVNMFGEWWEEYILWLVLTPVLVIGLHYTIEAMVTLDS